MNKKKKAATVEEYIASFPPSVRKKLKQIRSLIKKGPPEITEKIGYGMPSYAYHGVLLYFAAYEKHIGFYAMPSAMKKYADEIEKYDHSSGTIRFNIEKELPLKLIEKIIKFRIKENADKKKGKKNQPKMFR